MDHPVSNIHPFLNYSNLGDLLASLDHLVLAYDPGGKETGITERWEQKKMSIKNFTDDVSGSKKIHTGVNYNSRSINGIDEIRYLHALSLIHI